MKREGNLIFDNGIVLNLDFVAAFKSSISNKFGTDVFCGGNMFTINVKKAEFEKVYKDYIKSRNLFTGKLG